MLGFAKIDAVVNAKQGEIAVGLGGRESQASCFLLPCQWTEVSGSRAAWAAHHMGRDTRGLRAEPLGCRGKHLAGLS